jgi:cellulose synthase operon protein C
LRAGDALVRNGHAEASPAGMLRLARQWGSDPAADPTQRHVGAMALAAAKLWRAGDPSALTPAEIGVVFAGRHNYMTDGPGTPFAKVKSRLFKTIHTSIPRASESRWKTVLPRVVGKHKTAFAILDKGIHSAHLDLIEKERAALRTSVDQALASLAAQIGADAAASDATRSLAAIVARMAQTGGDAASVLVERAELARWTARPACAYGDVLDGQDYAAISAAVRAAFARLPIPSASAPPAHRQAWLSLYRFAATLRRAEERGGKKAWEPLRKHLANRSATLDIDKLDVMAKRWPQARAAAAEDWKTLTRIAHADPIKPRDLTADGVKEALDELAATMKSGGKVVLVDGGQVGFSTAGLSANVGKLLHAGGIVVSPRLNLRVRGGRQAFVEYGRRTACFSFSAGSQSRVAFDAGAGVQVGGDYVIVRAGVTFNVVAYQTDCLDRRAFSLIVARRMKADGSGFDDARLQRGMLAVNAFLFDHARDQDLTDSEAAWQALAQTFLGNDDFSVVWNEQQQQERRHGVNVSGGVSVKAALGETSARLGPQFGYAYDYATRNVADSEDTGGTTAIESHRSGRGGRHIASGGLSTSLGNSPTATAEMASFGLLSSEFPMVRYRVRDRQHVAKMSLVREEGRLVHRVSYADTEFAHFDDYAHALRNDERWALMFGIDPDAPAIPSAANPAQAANREAIIARGKQRIALHLAQVKRDHRDNQLLFHRFRLREHAAKQLDAYADRAATVRASGGSADEIARWEQDYADVLARPDSWLPVEFKGYERVARQSSPGLNFGVRLTHDQSITGERELISMIHSPSQLDAIDRVWPRD